MTEAASKRLRVGSIAALILAALFALTLYKCTDRYGDKTLLELLVMLRSDVEAPGLTVAEAAHNLRTATAATAFVRDHVRYSAYKGHLQSPETVLRRRSGNVTDRALLLAALFDQLGVKYRIRRAVPWASDLPDDVSPEPGTAMSVPKPLVAAIAKRIGYDMAKLPSDFESMKAALAAYAKSAKVDVGLVEKTLNSITPLASSHYLEADSQYYDDDWLWLESGPKTHPKIFDPNYPGLKRATADTVDKAEFGSPPPLDFHLDAVRRDGEREELLSWSGPAAGQDIDLTFLPTVNTEKILQGAVAPDKVGLWTPALSVGGKYTFGIPITPHGAHPGFVPSLAPYGPNDPVAGNGKVLDARLVRIDARAFPEVRAFIDVKTDGPRRFYPSDLRLTDRQVRQSVRIKSVAASPAPVVVVTDISGSMERENRWNDARAAMDSLVAVLGPRTPLGIVTFAADAKVVRAAAALGDGADARAAISSVKLGSDTAILRGMNKGLDLLGGRKGAIILLTDGQDTMGGDRDALFKRIRESKATVYAIGIGPAPDEKLLRRFAEISNGRYWNFLSANTIDNLYGALGSKLGGLLTVDYRFDAGRNSSPDARVAKGHGASGVQGGAPIPEEALAHEVQIGITGFSPALSRSYSEPKQPLRAPPRLVVDIDWGRRDARQTLERTLAVLDGRGAPWKLLSLNRIQLDLGPVNGSVLFAGYLSQWISALRHAGAKADKKVLAALDADTARRISFSRATQLNGLRQLVNVSTKGTLKFSPGPNIYIEKRNYMPGKEGINRVRSFDIAAVWGRGHAKGSAESDQAMRLDISAGLAEGQIVGGGDAVHPLLAARRDLRALAHKAEAPKNWPWDLRFLRSKPELASFDWIWSPGVAGIAWAVNAHTRRFLPFSATSGVVGKGASVEQIAREFDHIDKMLAAYGSLGSWAGDAAGADVMGPPFAMLVAFKREENKLWCYSSVMLGYLNEAIGGDKKALLNRSAEKTKASALRLCKMDYDPTEFARHAWAKASEQGATSWAMWFAKTAANVNQLRTRAAVLNVIDNGKKVWDVSKFAVTISPRFNEAMINARDRIAAGKAR